jgi:hypothetical protein
MNAPSDHNLAQYIDYGTLSDDDGQPAVEDAADVSEPMLAEPAARLTEPVPAQTGPVPLLVIQAEPGAVPAMHVELASTQVYPAPIQAALAAVQVTSTEPTAMRPAIQAQPTAARVELAKVKFEPQDLAFPGPWHSDLDIKPEPADTQLDPQINSSTSTKRPMTPELCLRYPDDLEA